MGGIQAFHLWGNVKGESNDEEKMLHSEEVTLGPWGSTYCGSSNDTEVNLERKKAEFYWPLLRNQHPNTNSSHLSPSWYSPHHHCLVLLFTTTQLTWPSTYSTHLLRSRFVSLRRLLSSSVQLHRIQSLVPSMHLQRTKRVNQEPSHSTKPPCDSLPVYRACSLLPVNKPLVWLHTVRVLSPSVRWQPHESENIYKGAHPGGDKYIAVTGNMQV